MTMLAMLVTCLALSVAPLGGVHAGGFYAATPAGVYVAGVVVSVTPAVRISPSVETVLPGEVVAFTATEPVTWSVTPRAGVDVGSIDGGGVYTGPTGRMPPPGHVTVRGESEGTGEIGTACVYVASGTADGTFAVATMTGGVLSTSGLVDADEDGVVDLLVGRGHGSNVMEVAFYRGLGDGGFAEPVQAFYGQGAGAVYFGDVNGDGMVDLIRTGGNWIYTAMGHGDGRFGDGTPAGGQAVLAGQPVWDVALADMSGDGALDMATVAGQDNVTVWLNDGSGGFSTSPGARGRRRFVWET